MATSIQITEELQLELSQRRLCDRETYEEVIWGLIEDTRELSDETRRLIRKSRLEASAGETHKLAKVKKELGI